MSYDEVTRSLREAYNSSADVRDKAELAAWKVEERQRFLSLLQQEGKQTLLEIGAGTGKDSKFFQDHGLKVVCTDLTPEMVARCQEKGLTAYVMDFLHLDFPASSFDAVYALNWLLHVPSQDLPDVLQTIQLLLKPNGLFFMGLYGGIDFEGIWPEDRHEPKRFFSFHSDEWIQETATKYFELHSFKPINVGRGGELHFQSLILRRR